MSLSLMNAVTGPVVDRPAADLVGTHVARLGAAASEFPGPFATLLGHPGEESDVTVEEVRLGLACPLTLRRIGDLPVRQVAGVAPHRGRARP